jgi:hypothetical protein
MRGESGDENNIENTHTHTHTELGQTTRSCFCLLKQTIIIYICTIVNIISLREWGDGVVCTETEKTKGQAPINTTIIIIENKRLLIDYLQLLSFFADNIHESCSFSSAWLI